ncbi:MAG: hypothetical protein WCT46_00980 [Candidatus Gracilibacteria bacterium]|jgi:addiction module RelB/DinJ family antitoxin
MTTISFKTDDSLKNILETIAGKKGINLSAYIKLILTKQINEELLSITENGLTVAEELRILESEKSDKKHGPFKTAKETMNALRS